MQLPTSTLIAAAALAAAFPLPRGAPEGVLALPLQRVTQTTQAARALAGRDDDDDYYVNLENQLAAYAATLQIGTPAQSVQVIIDTGSWDLWVYSDSYLADNFDETASSTYKVTSKGGFGDRYNTQSWTTGDWATDNVGVAGATIRNQALGVVTNASIFGTHGIFGVGYFSNQASSHLNVPAQLKKQGYVQRNVFSLYLNKFDTSSGAITFGGFDTAKFEGKLAKATFHGDDFHGPNAFDLDITIGDVSTPALFDSGYTFSRVPTSFWNDFTSDLREQIPQLQADSSGHLYLTDSSLIPSSDQTLTINIGGRDFSFPYPALFGDYSGHGRQYLLLEDAQSESVRVIMGDAILRVLYLVYDLDGHSVYVGQAKYTEESNLQPILAGGLPAEYVL